MLQGNYDISVDFMPKSSRLQHNIIYNLTLLPAAYDPQDLRPPNLWDMWLKVHLQPVETFANPHSCTINPYLKSHCLPWLIESKSLGVNSV